MGRVWTDDHVKLLIKIIQKYDKIWNTNNPRFTQNKRVRHSFWEEITKLFNESHNEKKFKPVEVVSKWNNLRLHFEKECKKHSDESRWRYFSTLKFLAEHPPKKRQSVPFGAVKKYSLRKSVKREIHDETDTDISIGSMSPRNNSAEDFSLGQSEGQREVNSNCFRVKDDSEGISKHATDQAGHEKNKVDRQKTFGNYIAAELMHLEMDLQIRAKKIVFEVLMDLQYEQERRGRCVQL